jgi:AcrR family transcriptional regulator
MVRGDGSAPRCYARQYHQPGRAQLPILVDHQKRRTELIDVAIDLIVEQGLNGASVRAIAARAGYSAVVVQHYFRSKNELLRLAFERVIALLQEQVECAIADRREAPEALAVFLPADPVAARTWRVFFAFWGMALAHDDFQQAQARRSREGRDIISRVLEECSTIPEGAAGGRSQQANRLLALIAGIAAMATFDPEGWPPAQQRRILTEELQMLALG